MSLPLIAVAAYVAVAAYLHRRGVPPRRIARILGAGLLGGLVAAAVLGTLYFLIILARPVETISVFCILGVLCAAAQMAREEILGTITPLGVILLNVAATFAAGASPLPMSLAGLARLLPLPPGPALTAASIAIGYAPAWIALYLLRRGAPGHPLLRFLLGAWCCWIGIAAIAGPGWSAMAEFRTGEPARWIAAGFAAFAAVHLVMLALNLVLVFSARDEQGAWSLARSVRVDSMKASHALGIGVAFWALSFAWARTPFAYDLKAGALLAAAFALGSLLARGPAASGEAPAAMQPEPRPFPLGLVVGFGFPLAIVAAIGLWAWRDLSSEARLAEEVPFDVPAGTTLRVADGSFGAVKLRYPELELHAELKRRLYEQGVTYAVSTVDGSEVLIVGARDRSLALKAIGQVERRRAPPP
ncbi:MAG TPA: hypothetical protein VFK48_11325 [Usitatibacter sp.]|nr:hypothetical protein [Usitatibacter sp.]